MEQLDTKVRQELSTIKTRLDKMKEEIIVYEDIDKLKTQAQEKREALLKEQTSLMLRKDTTKKVRERVKEPNSSSANHSCNPPLHRIIFIIIIAYRSRGTRI